MALSNGYSAFKRLTSSALSALVDSQPRQTGYIAHTKQNLPLKYAYKRPDFLELDDEATLASADHDIRPVMHPRRPLIMSAGYSEVINAGKTPRINEDQSAMCSFSVEVPTQYQEEFIIQGKEVEVPVTYFAVFDGHAGKDVSVMASHRLHDIIKQKLEEVVHMILLTDEELKLKYLNLGLIMNVTSESLVVGAIEEAFMMMDQEVAREKQFYRIDGGCTALVALFMMDKLFVANAGDCRAVIYKSGKTKDMSYDHTPETERKRVQRLAFQKPSLLGEDFTRLQFQHRPRKKDLGSEQLFRDRHMEGWALKTIEKPDIKPQLVTGEGKHARLLDTIGTTRGFGDHDLKMAYNPNMRIKPFLSSEPEVQVYSLSGNTFGDDDVLVMASDGLWERFSNNTLLSDTLRGKFRQQSPDDARRYIVAAQSLVDVARGNISERGWRMTNGEVASYDDISVFVIPLKNATKHRVSMDGCATFEKCRVTLDKRGDAKTIAQHPVALDHVVENTDHVTVDADRATTDRPQSTSAVSNGAAEPAN